MSILVFNLLLLLLLVFMNYNIYFLSFLIMMEYLIVVLLFFMLLINFNSWLYFIYLVYAVCEGVLGLSLLVSMNYEYGHQKISFINLY